MKFLSIVATNLDEFFMIRVSATQKKLREGIEDVAPDGYNTQQQLEAMRARALRMLQDQAACWNELRTLLEGENISFLEAEQWTPEMREYLATHFSREICPVLTPLAFDPGHPFPLISNLSKNFAVVVRHGGRTKFARVKVPDVLPRFVAVPEALERPAGADAASSSRTSSARTCTSCFPARRSRARTCSASCATPTSAIEQDEADDLLETVDRSLKQLRHGALSLLQVGADMPPRVLNILVENFEVD